VTGVERLFGGEGGGACTVVELVLGPLAGDWVGAPQPLPVGLHEGNVERRAEVGEEVKQRQLPKQRRVVVRHLQGVELHRVRAGGGCVGSHARSMQLIKKEKG
jgi:hypothetical protein